MPENFDFTIQRVAERHLDACMQTIDEPGVPTPASAPFCGCHTCVVREVLHASYDLMLAEARREVADELTRLQRIEREAKAVSRGRQISRQAALNALPDLLKAVGNPWANDAEMPADPFLTEDVCDADD